ncbi:MAG: disulfide oxidoreductase, partial [Pseudomonadota bacterium]
QKDEALTGLARGFAFQMVEALGVIPRDRVAADVKALDQDARALLRKHGIRFGQFTIFLPLLLKPAPTRLRLILWSLWNELSEFPQSPPPGLVTIPCPEGAAEGYDAVAGYRVAGARAIRIDMLERLADQLRTQDTRGGFEATPDMLSITGMTLEQFADLMQGLGYRAERGEREKIRTGPKPAGSTAQETQETSQAVAAEATSDAATADSDAAAALGVDGVSGGGDATVSAAPEPASETEAATPVGPEADADAPGGDAPGAREAGETPDEPTEDAASEASEGAEQPADPEIEVFYTFAWAPRRPQGRGRSQRSNDGEAPGPHGKGKPKGKRQGQKGPRGQKGDGGKRHGGGKGQGGGAKRFEARPPKKEKAIDPDNPFAALLALKDKS